MNYFYGSDGARLAYRETGAGLPVVFLHPTPLDHVYWTPLIECLSGVRAIAPDFRGHGASVLGSSLPAGGFELAPDTAVLSMAQLAKDTLTLLDQLDIGKAVFVGCSIGGSVLLEVWRQAPERLSGLAFVCAKPQPDTAAAREKRGATITQVHAGMKESLFDGMAQSLIGATARARRPEIVAELRARMTISAEALVAVQAGLAVRPDSVPTVATIDVPVLAVAGGEDVSATVDEAGAFRTAPGGCEFHVLTDAGHFSAYEQPDVVAGWLTKWLGRFRG